MGIRTFPHLEKLLKPVSIKSMWRIVPRRHIKRPLGMGFGNSRFSAPNEEFKILYAASTIETALREGIIRDKLDLKKQRRIAEHALRNFASVVVTSNSDLLLLDLTDGGAAKMGIPSDIRHAKDYTKSQAFSLEVYAGMEEVNGFLYRSRLDDQICVAIYDRAVETNLASPTQMPLASNPLTRPALKAMNINTFRWRGQV